MTTPVRTLRLLGAEILVLTNAAGSLRPEAGPGSLVALTDHINMQGFNPLMGANEDDVGPRFPSLSAAYDPELRAGLHAVADELGTPLHDGVYLAVTGPSFETPAEIRAFRTLGADLVGMSTVPEAIVARHCGLRVAAVSVVTNLAEGMGDVALFARADARGGPPRGRAPRPAAASLGGDGTTDVLRPGADPPQARRRRARARRSCAGSCRASPTAASPTARPRRSRWRCSSATSSRPSA